MSTKALTKSGGETEQQEEQNREIGNESRESRRKRTKVKKKRKHTKLSEAPRDSELQQVGAEEEAKKKEEEERKFKEQDSLMKEEIFASEMEESFASVTKTLGLETMEMDGDMPKALPSMLNYREAVIEINQIAEKRNKCGTPFGEEAKAKRAETEELVKGMLEKAREYEKRYETYIKDPSNNFAHAKEAEKKKQKEFTRAGQKAEYLAKKKEFQKLEARAAQGNLKPGSQFMRLLLVVQKLTAMDSAAKVEAQAAADNQDAWDENEETFDTANGFAGDAGALAGTFTSDMSDFIKEMENKGDDWELFKDIKFMSLLSPILDSIGLVKEIVSLIKHSKEMTQDEYDSAVKEILGGSTVNLFLDSLTSLFTILGTLDTIPIIGTIIGLLKSAISFCNLAVKYDEKKAHLDGMRRRREMLKLKIVEQKNKLEYEGDEKALKVVKGVGSISGIGTKTKMVRYAKKLERETGAKDKELNDKRQEWKKNKDTDQNAKVNYYRVKIAGLLKEYTMTCDGEKKAKDEMWDIGVDSVKEGIGVASTIAKAFPGYGTAVGMVLDGVAVGVSLGNYVGKKVSQSWTDHFHAESDSSTSSTDERTNQYARSIMTDLMFLNTKIDASKGKYTGGEEEESYVMGKVASINGILDNLGCPLSKLLSAKNMKQLHNYIAAAFTA